MDPVLRGLGLYLVPGRVLDPQRAVTEAREAEAMGERARERARAHFGPAQHYEQLLAVYRSL